MNDLNNVNINMWLKMSKNTKFFSGLGIFRSSQIKISASQQKVVLEVFCLPGTT